MHTSGLVITFSEDPALAKASLVEIAAAGVFTLGEAMGPCQPVVLQVSDPQEARTWHDWLSELAGIESVEVVFVHWDEMEVRHAGA